MTLSELSTERAADVLCELVPFVSNIATDDELIAELKREIAPGGVTTRAELLALGAEKVSKLVPIVFKKRKADVFGVLAVLNGKTVEDIAKQNLLATLWQIKEIIKDKDMMNFFKSCAGSEGSE